MRCGSLLASGEEASLFFFSRVAELCNNGLVSGGGLSHFHLYLGIEGQVNIHSASELDESHVVVDIAFLSFLGIGDDASCHGSSHLAYEDFVSGCSLYDNRGAFVFGRSLWQPCLFEVSVVMAHHLYESLHGKPVGMDIGDAHEDADHQTTVVEIFVLLHFLDDDDMAIGRGNNNIVRHLSLVNADGATEKIDNNGVNYGKDNYNGPKCNRATLIEKPTAQSDDAGIDGKAQQECRDSFVVYSVLLDFLQSSHGNMFLWQVQ